MWLVWSASSAFGCSCAVCTTPGVPMEPPFPLDTPRRELLADLGRHRAHRAVVTKVTGGVLGEVNGRLERWAGDPLSVVPRGRYFVVELRLDDGRTVELEAFQPNCDCRGTRVAHGSLAIDTHLPEESTP